MREIHTRCALFTEDHSNCVLRFSLAAVPDGMEDLNQDSCRGICGIPGRLKMKLWTQRRLVKAITESWNRRKSQIPLGAAFVTNETQFVRLEEACRT